MKQQLDLERPAGPNGAAVLLCTGAMNPAHKGHVQMLEQARVRLEEAGIAVLGAFASPTHDDYVQNKARRSGTVGLSGAFRMEVLKRTVANVPLVNASNWEVNNPDGFVDYPLVVAEMSEWLHEVSEVRGDDVYGIYVCGSDHANAEDLWSVVPDAWWGGVVVVPRAGDVLWGGGEPRAPRVRGGSGRQHGGLLVHGAARGHRERRRRRRGGGDVAFRRPFPAAADARGARPVYPRLCSAGRRQAPLKAPCCTSA